MNVTQAAEQTAAAEELLPVVDSGTRMVLCLPGILF